MISTAEKHAERSRRRDRKKHLYTTFLGSLVILKYYSPTVTHGKIFVYNFWVCVKSIYKTQKS